MIYQASDKAAALRAVKIKSFTVPYALNGRKKARLGGIEPPHLPPEGSALSTELQTCITCIPERKHLSGMH